MHNLVRSDNMPILQLVVYLYIIQMVSQLIIDSYDNNNINNKNNNDINNNNNNNNDIIAMIITYLLSPTSTT